MAVPSFVRPPSSNEARACSGFAVQFVEELNEVETDTLYSSYSLRVISGSDFQLSADLVPAVIRSQTPRSIVTSIICHFPF
jgi:hypothetical protein